MDNYIFDSSKVGKNICYILNGSGGAMPGKIVEVHTSEGFLILSTRFSSKQYVALDAIDSFWFEDDKPED